MKIEQKVCSIEQAKHLKKLLGGNKKTDWFWVYPAHDHMISTTYGVYHKTVAYDFIEDNEGNEFDSEMSSAYDASELGAMLPFYTYVEQRIGSIGLNLSNGKTDAYWQSENELSSLKMDGLTLVDAMANCLIDLLENFQLNINELTIDDINPVG